MRSYLKKFAVVCPSALIWQTYTTWVRCRQFVWTLSTIIVRPKLLNHCSVKDVNIKRCYLSREKSAACLASNWLQSLTFMNTSHNNMAARLVASTYRSSDIVHDYACNACEEKGGIKKLCFAAQNVEEYFAMTVSWPMIHCFQNIQFLAALMSTNGTAPWMR